jgi:hypothetical protein
VGCLVVRPARFLAVWAVVLVEVGQRGLDGARVGMGDAQRRFADVDGLLIFVAGAGGVAECLQYMAESGAPFAQLGMVGAEGGFADAEGLLALVAGVVQVAQIV